jgi:hypothetical protein
MCCLPHACYTSYHSNNTTSRDYVSCLRVIFSIYWQFSSNNQKDTMLQVLSYLHIKQSFLMLNTLNTEQWHISHKGWSPGLFRRGARNLNVEQKTPDCCFCEQGDDNVDSTLRNFLNKHQLLKKSSLSGVSQVRGVRVQLLLTSVSSFLPINKL